MKLAHARVLGFAVAVLSSLTYACSSPEPSSTVAFAEPTGTLSAALSGVGPDGVTYTLPSQTWLRLVGQGSTANQSVSLTGNGATQSFSVPAGTYAGTLQGGPADGGLWTLTRSGDAGVVAVPAQLTDPQPYAITITAGQATPLTLHFTVLGVGPITFSTGTLTTGIQVGSATTAPGHVLITGSGTMPPPYQTTLAPVASLLSYAGSASLSYAQTLTLTSPFTVSADSVCANVTSAATGSSSADAGTAGVALADFVVESATSTGQLCFSDANSQNQVSLSLTRTGSALTAPFASALGEVDAGATDGGGATALFAFETYISQAAPYYNGTTLVFPTQTVPANVEMQVYENGGVTGVSGTETVTLQFTP